ncbi:glycosyltransferase family 2 protein [Myxococcota bacterium]|jgi:glycosyltransferase involved in cell wall biosynthesis|nr:glycosyltransferase family 2 protein [Myxococcota bacterium]MBP8970558.1 glycosyltransferase family 2 protein [Myxococcota bacterium]OQC41524.1 MAG: Poly-beta-1,6-N-acetyl-D-glucosamine synthase [Deltaproteobacteria bacterium ADurb.Bin058]HHW95880.1 glycosyltransferase family 2 protein [Oligoflexales bacterium]HQL57322.1 glycosyltransferase family 2 protein [Myxococcota bacterium]
MNEKSHQVSVIVPVFNAGTALQDCVKAIVASDFKPHEVILVDDCSTDSKTIFLLDSLQKEFSRLVKVVKLKKNSGPGVARNSGAAAANGDLLFFCDADTRLDKKALGIFVKTIDTGVDAVCGVYSPNPLNPGFTEGYKAAFDHYNFSKRGVVPYNTFSAYCAGVSAQAYRQVGGFNESLTAKMEYENEEFGRRLSEHYKMVINPEIVTEHHFPGFTALTKTYFYRVALWVGLFLSGKGFDDAGDSTSGTGFATLAALGALVLALLVPCLGVFGSLTSTLLIVIWLVGYLGFFSYVSNAFPSRLAIYIALNYYFSVVIGMGAIWGLFRYATSAQFRRQFKRG